MYPTSMRQKPYRFKYKEFANVLIQIITQLPSLGIGILIVPHRAQGVVDKTTRSQMQFRAAVRATDDVIKETFPIWYHIYGLIISAYA